MVFIPKMNSRFLSIPDGAITTTERMFYFVLELRLAMSVGIWPTGILHRLFTYGMSYTVRAISYRPYRVIVNFLKTINTFDSHNLGGIVNFENTAIIIGKVKQMYLYLV